MPVPSTFADLTPVASTNSPQGTESVKGTIDDYLRAHAALIRQLNDQLLGPTVTLASAATVAIGFAAALNVAITGTTTITAFDTAAEGTLRWVTFAGALTLIHNGTSLQLPGVANIATAAGDAALFKSLGGGNWKCLDYVRVTGEGVIQASTSRNGYLSAADWNTFNGKQAAGACLSLAGGTMTGQLLLKEGTASLPGLSFTNDGAPDTGLYHISDGAFGISCNAIPIAQFSTVGVAVTGTMSATTVTQTSDERKKKRWQRLPGDFIMKLAGIKKSGLFHWKKGGDLGLGIGAQSLEAILPVAVHTDESGAKTVNYGAAAMVSVVELARAVVDLQARVRELEPR